MSWVLGGLVIDGVGTEQRAARGEQGVDMVESTTSGINSGQSTGWCDADVMERRLDWARRRSVVAADWKSELGSVWADRGDHEQLWE